MKIPLVLKRASIQKVNHCESSRLFPGIQTYEQQHNNTNQNERRSVSSYGKLCNIFITLLLCYTFYMFFILSSLSNLIQQPTTLNNNKMEGSSSIVSIKPMNIEKNNMKQQENLIKNDNFFQCTNANNNNITNKTSKNHQKLDSWCTYFNIKNFFDSPNGLGHKYIDIAHEYKQKTIFRDLRFYHIRCNHTTTSTIIPQHLSYIHIHKNGGTTIREAFYNILNKSKTRCQGTIFESPEIREMKITKPRLIRTTSKIMEKLVQRQKAGDMSNHILLSFLREPVHRFLSSVGETIRQNHIFGCTRILATTTTNTPQATIQCIIQDILSRGTIIETHYTPAAIELYLSDSGKGVTISLYDMKHLKYFLSNKLHFENSNVKLRSAASKEYNGKFNISLEDLNKDMIQDICYIYAMDVILLRSIGISTPYCN